MSYNIPPYDGERFFLGRKVIPLKAKIILLKAKRIKFYIQIASPYDGERSSFRVQTTPLKAK